MLPISPDAVDSQNPQSAPPPLGATENLVEGPRKKRTGMPGVKNPMYKHGRKSTPEYAAWNGMKNRCYNKNVKHYAS